VGATGTPVVQFQYVDVGVNMDITPKVLLTRDVSMSVVVQVQALAGSQTIGGVTQPVFTNRQITHEIRLSEGETNILGGIITDQEQVSMNGIPGLKNIPILKYFFGQEEKSRLETEIIILLTPHIVRMPAITEANLRSLYIGTEVNTQLRRISAAAPSETPAPAPTPGPAANAQPAQNLRPANATLTFAPAPVTLAAPTTVNLNLTGTNIYGTDITLEFDPAALSITDIKEGGFLSRDGQIVAFVERADAGGGTLHISVERPPGAPPLSGAGNILTMTLAPTPRKGQSTLRVTEFHVRDAQGNVQVGPNAEVQVTTP
jgi:general secretion pathway protein D